MKIVNDISQLKTEIRIYKALGLTVGFVPTMGALHEGHLSLVRESNEHNDVTVVSIFVNPTQFNDKKDLENYPSTLQADQRLLSEEQTSLLFLPTFESLYPDNYHYKVSEDSLSQTLCGAHRPGHFDGVLTVVMKLLNLVDADHAYFGEKDFQQLSLIRGMTEAFFHKTQIISCPTVREEDGLAMSSRNRLLTPEERQKAAKFPKILSAPGLELKERRSLLEQAGFAVDYIEEKSGRRFGAVRIGSVRLIDNFAIPQEVANEASNTL